MINLHMDFIMECPASIPFESTELIYLLCLDSSSPSERHLLASNITSVINGVISQTCTGDKAGYEEAFDVKKFTLPFDADIDLYRRAVETAIPKAAIEFLVFDRAQWLPWTTGKTTSLADLLQDFVVAATNIAPSGESSSEVDESSGSSDDEDEEADTIPPHAVCSPLLHFLSHLQRSSPQRVAAVTARVTINEKRRIARERRASMAPPPPPTAPPPPRMNEHQAALENWLSSDGEMPNERLCTVYIDPHGAVTVFNVCSCCCRTHRFCRMICDMHVWGTPEATRI